MIPGRWMFTNSVRRSGVTLVGRSAAPEFSMSVVTSTRLHGETHNPWRRGFSTNGSLREIVGDVRNDAPLLLDNLEVLFEASLNINPLNVIKLLAHSRLVIAAWPGELRNDRLIYAGMGHPEHRDYTRDGVVVFETAQGQQGTRT